MSIGLWEFDGIELEVSVFFVIGFVGGDLDPAGKMDGHTLLDDGLVGAGKLITGLEGSEVVSAIKWVSKFEPNCKMGLALDSLSKLAYGYHLAGDIKLHSFLRVHRCFLEKIGA